MTSDRKKTIDFRLRFVKEIDYSQTHTPECNLQVIHGNISCS